MHSMDYHRIVLIASRVHATLCSHFFFIHERKKQFISRIYARSMDKIRVKFRVFGKIQSLYLVMLSVIRPAKRAVLYSRFSKNLGAINVSPHYTLTNLSRARNSRESELLVCWRIPVSLDRTMYKYVHLKFRENDE